MYIQCQSIKEKSSLSQKLSFSNSFLVGDGTMCLFLLLGGIFFGLNLCMFCVFCYSLCELIHASVLYCLEDTLSLSVIHYLWLLQSFCSLKQQFLSLRRMGCSTQVSLKVEYTAVSYSLHLDQLWVFAVNSHVL